AAAPDGGGPSGTGYSDIVAVGPNDAWVIESTFFATSSYLVHCTATTCARLSNTSMDNMVIAGSGPNDVWISSRTAGHYVLQHWNGTTLTTVSTPAIGLVDRISAIAPNDAWAGGFEGWLHWDGAAWTRVPSVDGSAFDGTAADDLWSVGAGAGSSSRILHYGLPLTFADVPPASTFFAPIDTLACRGILNGYTCGAVGEPCDSSSQPYYRPAGPVSRGQAAKLVAGAAGRGGAARGQQFTDVPPGSTFYPWIETLGEAGILSGYQCGSRPDEPCDSAQRAYFRPSAGMTRGQLSKIVALTHGYSDPPTSRLFEDVPPENTFYTWVQQVGNLGIISGYTCGGLGEPCVEPAHRPYFRPTIGAARGQTAKITSGVFFSILP
ncbi:MAG: S-layer homology domain-containing protein, partial [Chloroflexota bacterium]|nr:S-layer homology domain-containing protein [Chloroflexota bacterium]